MFYREHEPAHFHAYYGSQMILVEIETGRTAGHMPRRVQALVLEWLNMHREELLRNWELAKLRLPLKRIEPLE